MARGRRLLDRHGVTAADRGACRDGLGGNAAERCRAQDVMLHFAYGANMHRDIMCRHAPAATAVGMATLADHRFIITADGYASVTPVRARTVHGILWRITPRASSRRWSMSRDPAAPADRRRVIWSLWSRRRAPGTCRATIFPRCSIGCRAARRVRAPASSETSRGRDAACR